MRINLTPLSASHPRKGQPFLQAEFWAQFKSDFGWTFLSFALDFAPGVGEAVPPDAETESTELRVLVRRLAGPFSFAYVPGGPALECPANLRSELLAELGAALRPHLPPTCILIRFDPPWYEPEGKGRAAGFDALAETAGPVVRPIFRKPLRKAGSDVQPPDTVLLSLKPGEEEILAGMKPKWRYNIRLSAKKGVLVGEEGEGGLPVFYRLYEETSKRDRIAIHPLKYYEGLFAKAKFGPGSPDLRLWVARHEGEALAAIITLFYGDTATYLYGASSDTGRELMPSYALQWAAIRAAREAGCVVYDFYGIPPTDDSDHPMAGLYRFKTGFGGQVVHYAGSWDLVLSAPLYLAWQAAESLRTYWFKNLRKRSLRKP